MEWVTLAVLVPAIVVPAVLLLGFTGCDLVFRLDPPEPPAFEQTFVAAFTGADNLRGRCLVQRIEPLRLSDSGSLVQITLQALDQSVVIDRILVSQPAAAGDPYDSAADLTEVASNVLVAANTSVTLPAVTYALDRTQPLLVAMDVAQVSGDVPFVGAVPANEAVAFIEVGAEAATPDRRPGYASRARIYAINRIDVA